MRSFFTQIQLFYCKYDRFGEGKKTEFSQNYPKSVQLLLLLSFIHIFHVQCKKNNKTLALNPLAIDIYFGFQSFQLKIKWLLPGDLSLRNNKNPQQRMQTKNDKRERKKKMEFDMVYAPSIGTDSLDEIFILLSVSILLDDPDNGEQSAKQKKKKMKERKIRGVHSTTHCQHIWHA